MAKARTVNEDLARLERRSRIVIDGVIIRRRWKPHGATIPHQLIDALENTDDNNVVYDGKLFNMADNEKTDGMKAISASKDWVKIVNSRSCNLRVERVYCKGESDVNGYNKWVDGIALALYMIIQAKCEDVPTNLMFRKDNGIFKKAKVNGLKADNVKPMSLQHNSEERPALIRLTESLTAKLVVERATDIYFESEYIVNVLINRMKDYGIVSRVRRTSIKIEDDTGLSRFSGIGRFNTMMNTVGESFKLIESEGRKGVSRSALVAVKIAFADMTERRMGKEFMDFYGSVYDVDNEERRHVDNVVTIYNESTATRFDISGLAVEHINFTIISYTDRAEGKPLLKLVTVNAITKMAGRMNLLDRIRFATRSAFGIREAYDGEDRNVIRMSLREIEAKDRQIEHDEIDCQDKENLNSLIRLTREISNGLG